MARQKEIKTSTGWGQGFSRFAYDVNGHLKSATDVVGKREFRYLVDGDGHVLRRDEYLGSEIGAVGGQCTGNRTHRRVVSREGAHHYAVSNVRRRLEL